MSYICVIINSKEIIDMKKPNSFLRTKEIINRGGV